jgi:hypothetical protein
MASTVSASEPSKVSNLVNEFDEINSKNSVYVIEVNEENSNKTETGQCGPVIEGLLIANLCFSLVNNIIYCFNRFY